MGLSRPARSMAVTAYQERVPPAPLGVYSIPAGQAYVAAGPEVHADDLPASSDSPGVPVAGTGRHVAIQFDHRLALVGADNVTVTKAAG